LACHHSMSQPSLDGEARRRGVGSGRIGPRDFVVAQGDGTADHSYRVGRIELPDSGLLAAVVAVAKVDSRLLVAVPEAVWHRTLGRSLLPTRAISKPILCSVAACSPEQRDLVGFGGKDVKVWFGLLLKLITSLRRQSAIISRLNGRICCCLMGQLWLKSLRPTSPL
jgi:hypothetical protein